MRRLIYILLIVLLSCSINSNLSNESRENEESDHGYYDGTYCAEVTYYNSNTGTKSSYTLTVESESNLLIQINWPSGGWMKNDQFGPAELDENGYTSFTSDIGYDYEVQITGDVSDCFTDVHMTQQCIGITKDGDQCENMTDNENGLCWQHQDQE